jgi:hypothetical protein
MFAISEKMFTLVNGGMQYSGGALSFLLSFSFAGVCTYYNRTAG